LEDSACVVTTFYNSEWDNMGMYSDVGGYDEYGMIGGLMDAPTIKWYGLFYVEEAREQIDSLALVLKAWCDDDAQSLELHSYHNYREPGSMGFPVAQRGGRQTGVRWPNVRAYRRIRCTPLESSR
jgi:hypothetical protein